jgi:hypothetical protein
MWRVGRKLGRTLYLDEDCVGMVDTHDIAKRIVDAMNTLTCRLPGVPPSAHLQGFDEKARKFVQVHIPDLEDEEDLEELSGLLLGMMTQAYAAGWDQRAQATKGKVT